MNTSDDVPQGALPKYERAGPIRHVTSNGPATKEGRAGVVNGHYIAFDTPEEFAAHKLAVEFQLSPDQIRWYNNNVPQQRPLI